MVMKIYLMEMIVVIQFVIIWEIIIIFKYLYRIQTMTITNMNNGIHFL